MTTVVITTYKRPADIVKRAIMSIVNQTLKEWELIVVDDSPASFEGREEVKNTVLSFASKHNVRYIAHEKNIGACAARNTGLAAAKGEYIAYLDDDDEWDPRKLELQLSLFEKGGDDLALVYCSCYLQISDLTGKKSVVELGKHRGDVISEIMKRNFAGGASNPMISVRCARAVNGFDVEMRAAQDYDFWSRLAEKYKFDYVEEPLIIYHLQNDACISSNPQNRIAGMERLMKKHEEYLKKHPEAYYMRGIMICRDYARGGKRIEAFKMWCKCIFIKPLWLKSNGRTLLSIIRNGWFPGKRYY